jgi:hypothetical protein
MSAEASADDPLASTRSHISRSVAAGTETPTLPGTGAAPVEVGAHPT